MKERPIIFSTDMVRAILGGTKTMTRRTRGLEKINEDPDNWELLKPIGDNPLIWYFKHSSGFTYGVKCPYGQVGDRLWVREAFSDVLFQVSDSNSSDYIYKADWDKPLPYNGKWKPSIHMPRWASRILLEITEIRVERLQEITWADVLREGIGHSIAISQPRWMVIDNFRILWDSLNAKRGYGWETNPWVWVLGFKMSQG